MSIFDDVPMADGSAARPVKPGLFDDVPMAAAKPGVVEDVARSAVSGVGRGVAGLAGLPAFARDWLVDPVVSAPGRAYNMAFGSGRYEDTPSMARGRAATTGADLLPIPTSEGAQGYIDYVPGMSYRPQTVAGEYAGTLTEFATGLPFTAGSALQRSAQVVLPALASETAGQAARQIAPELEPYARMAGALGGGLGTALAQRPTTAQGLFRQAAGDLDDATVLRARGLIDSAAEQGVRLTWPEAIQQVTGGATRLGDLQRVVEQSAGGADVMRPFMAERAGQVQAAGNRTLASLADVSLDPITTGIRTQGAARAAMAETPEGIALSERVALNAPRTTADDAGAVIQPELRGVYDRREGMRAGLADQDYGAARQAPANVPLDGGFGYRDVQRVGLRPEPYVDDFPVPVPDVPAAPAASTGGAAARGRGPMPLSEFIARNGGLRLDDEMAYHGLDRFKVPGAGSVARKGGQDIDGYWRPKLMEAGYLRPDPDGYFTRDIRNELVDLLQRERAGTGRTFAAGDQDAAAARQAAAVDARNMDELMPQREAIRRELSADGFGRGIDDAALAKAAEARALGDPDYLTVYERAVMARPVNEFVPPATTGRMIPDVQTERMPVVRLGATSFGQVDARPVMSAIDGLLVTAKGAPRQALQAARQALMRPDGAVDSTVAGLDASRKAITDLIDQAKRAGAGNSVRQLEDALGSLDRALEAVPAYRQAARGFEAASRPLAPFGENRVPGQIVQRDQYGRDFTMPREGAAPAIERGGASAARDFADVAPAQSRQAYENYLATRLLDGATDASGNINADALRRSLRDNEDALRPFPAVSQRIEEIAMARRGMAPVERSPLGQIATREDVLEQARALLPNQPAAGVDEAVSQTVRRVVSKDPDGAQNLVRIYAQSVFDEATQALQTGPNQFGGAKFAAVITGNAQQARNLEAAVRALPRGHVKWEGFRRFLDIMEATGQRQPAGSLTDANRQIRAELSRGGAASEAGNAIRTGGLTVVQRLNQFYQEARLGQNTKRLAEIFTNPDADRLLRELTRTGPETAKAQALALRLTFMGERAVNSPNAANRPSR